MGDRQLAAVVELLRHILSADLIAVYLYVSARFGGLQPHSDLDLFAVSARPTSYGEKRHFVEQLLGLSEPTGPGRPVDLMLVVHADLVPWRYPPRFDFVYGDWYRNQYEGGIVESVPILVGDMDTDMRNVLLTLARIWSTLSTGQIRSKSAAADWASERLPADCRDIVQRARAAYRGEAPDELFSRLEEARRAARCMKDAIDGQTRTTATLPFDTVTLA